jgi:TRAP-type C4-dicarboxylate transport system permease small subunit
MNAADEEYGETDKNAASPPPQTLLERLVWCCGLLSAVLILYILGITVTAVFFRYVLGTPLLGVDEQVGFLVVATVMLGAAEALRRGDHIGIDILTERASAPVRRWLDALGFIAILIFAGVLLVSAWHTVTFSRQFGAYSTGALEIPMWIPQSALLVGALLLGLVALSRLAALFLRGRTR